jgi:transposase InsO family protein
VDITFIAMAGDFVYLAAVVDRFSRCVLAWRVSITVEVDFRLEAVEEALARYGKPTIFNTDQGSQFTSGPFTGLLLDNRIAIGMDGPSAWRDNVFVERQRRKTGWIRAETAGDKGPWRQQAILGRGRWEADALRDIVRDYALQTLADPDGVRVIDGTGLLKQEGFLRCGASIQRRWMPPHRFRLSTIKLETGGRLRRWLATGSSSVWLGELSMSRSNPI